jgi:hypothetical protein
MDTNAPLEVSCAVSSLSDGWEKIMLQKSVA